MSYTHIFLLLHTSSEYFLVFCSQCFKTNSISLTTQHVYCSYIVVCLVQYYKIRIKMSPREHMYPMNLNEEKPFPY